MERARLAGVAEVAVVDQGEAHAAAGEQRRESRLPDPLGEPHPRRCGAEMLRAILVHHRDLPERVALREHREHRLVEAAAEQLDLAAGDERAQPGEVVGALALDPLEQRAGVVEGAPDVGRLLERLDDPLVAIVVAGSEDLAEVAVRLMVVEREEEGHRRHGGN